MFHLARLAKKIILVSWIANNFFVHAMQFVNPLQKQLRDQLATQLYPIAEHRSSSKWQLLRHFPSGHLELLHRETSNHAFYSLPVNDHWRRSIYPMLLMEAGENLLVVGYDIIKNSPAGRHLTVGEPGFDLFEFNDKQPGIPRKVASGLKLGEIDSLLYGHATPDCINLCGDNHCLSISASGTVTQWNLANLSRYEFIEVVFDPSLNSAHALVRSRSSQSENSASENKPSFQLAQLTPTGDQLTPLSGKGIPWKLELYQGTPIWKMANNPNQIRQLLQYELGRMPHQGVMEFGTNNLEGRIAWSQCYYLNGLLSLLLYPAQFPYLNTELTNWIQKRLTAEIPLVAKLATDTYPNFQVKRYSLEREPQLFALHLGRIQKLLYRANQAGLSSTIIQPALTWINHKLITLTHTVEEKVEMFMPPDNKPTITLRYRPGYPFWADGINVPYNYLSGYVEGLLSCNQTETMIRYTQWLLSPLLTQVFTSKPFPNHWPYWWGWGDEGYKTADQLSMNTPQWLGNRGAIADITYRSMDAMALITLFQKKQKAVPLELIDHFRRLVASGKLLPFVNEKLIELDKKAKLSLPAVQQFCRSTKAWELQAQIWALADYNQGTS
ncbi:MAG: hypothetical protein AB2992_01540 [Candidatus Symbiodolus clandestinus]